MKGIFMKNLCLTLLFLSTTFAAQEEDTAQKYKRERIELFSITSKGISKKHENIALDMQHDYGIYGDVWNKCETISQTLGRNYKNRLENTDFEWQDKIDKAFFKIFFKVCAKQDLRSSFQALSAIVELDDQEKIADFLTNFDKYNSTWEEKEIEFHEIQDFFYKFSVIETIALNAMYSWR